MIDVQTISLVYNLKARLNHIAKKKSQILYKSLIHIFVGGRWKTVFTFSLLIKIKHTWPCSFQHMFFSCL